MISVIVPCKNRIEKLEKCINSIIKSIDTANQKIKIESEIIVVNDHSDDGFCETVKNKFPNVNIINSDGVGPGYAGNYGIKNSRGKYIFFTDSDCIVDELWIIEGYKEFEKKKSMVIQGVPWLFQKNVNPELGKNEEKLYEIMFSTYIDNDKTLMTDSRNLLISRDITLKMGDVVFSERSSKATAESRVFGKKCISHGIDIDWGVNVKVYHEDSKTMVDVCRQKYRHGMGRVEIWEQKPEFQYLRERYFDNPIRNGIDIDYILQAHFAFLYGYYSNLGDEVSYNEFIRFIEEVFSSYNREKDLYREVIEFLR